MPAVDAPVREIAWKPQPGPQTWLLSCPIEDIGFGGAKGGGKTDGGIGDWISHQEQYGKHAHGILFRRTYDELGEVMRRCQDLMPRIGAVWHAAASERAPSKSWEMGNGALLELRYLETEADATRYEGHEFTWQFFDEVGDWASPSGIDRLRSRLRSKYGIPCVSRCTFNPGGAGHVWLKKRYILPAPPLTPFYDKEKECHRVFIPAKLSDNKILTTGDPDYERRLRGSGTARQVKAWLHGDWSDDFNGKLFQVNLIQQLDLPAEALIRKLGLRPTQYWDLATKEKQLIKEDPNDDPDFSACLTVARDDLDRFILLHGWKGQVDAGKLIYQMHALQQRFKCPVKAEAGAIANVLSGVLPTFNKIAGREFAILPLKKGSRDKVEHSIQAQMLVNSGNVYVAADSDDWFPDFKEELRKFPIVGVGIHDDWVDDLSYAAEDLRRQQGPIERHRHASLPRDMTGSELEEVIARAKGQAAPANEKPWW